MRHLVIINGSIHVNTLKYIPLKKKKKDLKEKREELYGFLLFF